MLFWTVYQLSPSSWLPWALSLLWIRVTALVPLPSTQVFPVIDHSGGGCCRTKPGAVVVAWAMPRYGPPMKGEEEEDAVVREKDQDETLLKTMQRYRKLLESMLAVKDPQHIPSLLTRNLDFLLDLAQTEGMTTLARDLVNDAQAQGDDYKAFQLEQAIELSFSFVEDFVEQTSRIDKKNKEMMGMILRIVSAPDTTPREREDALDDFFSMERENLTAGFLRHIESECDRIANAPTMTTESRRLLDILRTIQARVVEELGEELGEAAQVLGQLIGYGTTVERLSVLEAGLTVRGVAFAYELKRLTEEALEGFEKVTKKVDPTLKMIIQELDDNLQEYIQGNSQFQ